MGEKNAVEWRNQISIILPAYECAAWLERCVDSVLGQTHQNWRLLLVCTHSQDGTEHLGKSLAEKDSRITYLDSRGVGVSVARNTALAYLTGRYTAFLDADDYVEFDYLERLLRCIEGHDISICGLDRVRGSGSDALRLKQDKEYSREELLADVLCDNAVGGYLCNKLFCTEIILRHKLCFLEDLAIGEDMLFVVQYLKYVQKGRYTNRVLYHYCVNGNSALQKMYTTGKFDKKKMSNMQAAQKISEELNTEGQTKRGCVQSAVSYRLVRTGMWTYFNTLKCHYYSQEILEQIRNSIKGHVRDYCCNPHSKKLEKLVACLVRFFPKGFWHLANGLMVVFPEKLQRKYIN